MVERLQAIGVEHVFGDEDAEGGEDEEEDEEGMDIAGEL